MLTASADLVDISLLNADIVALTGYAVVFLGLILLMVVVMLMGKCFTSKKPAQAPISQAPVSQAPISQAPVSQAPVAQAPAAPGTAGELKLHDVSPKTAAMLMAIVADKLGKPLNELRFISIKEVK